MRLMVYIYGIIVGTPLLVFRNYSEFGWMQELHVLLLHVVCLITNNRCLERNTVTENRGTHAMVMMVTCLLYIKAAMDATLHPMTRLEMIYFHRNTAKQTQPLVINTLGKGDNA